MKGSEKVRVNFRWEKEPLDAVKKAAALMGIPYQSYVKLVVFRQAVKDLKDADECINERL